MIQLSIVSIIRVVVYATKARKEPFTEWKDKLDKSVRADLIRRLDRVAMNNFGEIKQIKGGDGIWELRIDQEPGYRVYFGKYGLTVVILLVGGSKKGQTRDIAKAKQYWLEYKDSL